MVDVEKEIERPVEEQGSKNEMVLELVTASLQAKVASSSLPTGQEEGVDPKDMQSGSPIIMRPSIRFSE